MVSAGPGASAARSLSEQAVDFPEQRLESPERSLIHSVQGVRPLAEKESGGQVSIEPEPGRGLDSPYDSPLTLYFE